MKSFMSEFKEFALRGNVMDMAVGIIIGAAFTAIVTALVNNIISPIIGMFVKVDFNHLVATVNGVELQYGAFIMAIVNFVIVALVLFCIIKAMKKDEAEEEPTTKECPFCLQEIPIKATRCPHCTSQLDE